MRRVVITGLGAVTPLGNSVEETWAAIKAGKSGIGPITYYDTSVSAIKYGGQVKDFEAEKYMDAQAARKMARFTKYAVAAAKMALDDAGLTGNAEVLDKAAIYLGVGIGGFEVTENNCVKWYESGKKRVNPMTIPQLIPNEASGNIAIAFGVHGPCHTIATACSSGTDALGDALDLIRCGRRDVCIAGGTESTITGYCVDSFAALQALSRARVDDPTKACRPFDKDRD
ncbi:MAG: beta-ketoacyl-[Treponema sp.]|nr:beta-ketoacyl-[acyl-carrier-protein] synthase II [Treponema sp.]